MSISEPENPREVGELFRFISDIIDVFPADSFEETSDKLSLVACAGKYGIIFIANRSCIKVFSTKQLVDEKGNAPLKTFSVRGSITHITTSCDGQTLFVVSLIDGLFVFFYDIYHLLQSNEDAVPFYSVPLSTDPVSQVSSLSWNPCDATCIALALTTGDLCLMKIKDSSVEFTNKNGLGASAVTWSAKGKQLAVGKRDGTLTLFKPDLTLVRSIEAPPTQGIGPIIDITWFTNTEFFISYLSVDNLPALFYVNGPKGKPASFTPFEDVCYSSESGKPVSYYTIFISEWSLLFVFSSNGVDMGLVGKADNDSNKWCQWFPDEGSKALMHFYNIKEETFPLGFAVDFTSQKVFPTKDEKPAVGPFPVLMTLSTRGQLNIFFVENKIGDAKNVNIIREDIPVTGFRMPQQFGQPTRQEHQPPMATSVAPVELKSNHPSAFSLIPKKNEEPFAATPFAFSTPVKPQTCNTQAVTSGISPFTSTPSSSALFSALNSSSLPTFSSSTFPFSSTSSISAKAPFSSPVVPKPVSLSSKIGTTSLPAPSPQKSGTQPIPSFGETFTQATPSSQSLTHLPLSTATSSVLSPPPTVAAAVSTQSSAVSPQPSRVLETNLLREKKIKLMEEEFASEISELLRTNMAFECLVGTNVEDAETKVALEEARQWMEAMKKTTEELSDEVGNLHQKTMEASAFYEDANSHKQIKLGSRNEVYFQLRPLDPYSQRKLEEVRSKYQYLISQISEVNAKLDLVWEEFTSRKKSPGAGVPLDQWSTSENLYRSILNLHNMRMATEEKVDTITRRVKKLTTHPFISSRSTSSLDDVSSYSGILTRSSSKPILTMKKKRLNEILSERTHTPVRTHSSLNRLTPSGKDSVVIKDTFSVESDVGDRSHLLKVPPNMSEVSKKIGESDRGIFGASAKSSSSSPLAALCTFVNNTTSAETSSLSTSQQTSLNSADVKQKPTIGSVSASSFSFTKEALGVAPLSDSVGTVGMPQGSYNELSNKPVLGVGSSTGSTQPFTPIPFVMSSKMFGTPKEGGSSSTASASPTTQSALFSMMTGTTSTSFATATTLSGGSAIQNQTTSIPNNFFTPVCGISQSEISPSVSVSFSSLFASSTERKQIPFNVSLEAPKTESPATLFTVPKTEPISPKPAFSAPSSESFSKECSNVISSNPILSAQILKETKSESKPMPLGSSSQSFGLFGSLGEKCSSPDTSTSPFSLNFGQSALSTTSSSTVKTTTSFSSFTQANMNKNLLSQTVVTTSVLNQPTMTTLTSANGSLSVTDVFAKPGLTSQSSTPVSGTTLFSKPSLSLSESSQASRSEPLSQSTLGTSKSVPPSVSIIQVTSSSEQPTTSSIFTNIGSLSLSASNTTNSKIATPLQSVSEVTSASSTSDSTVSPFSGQTQTAPLFGQKNALPTTAFTVCTSSPSSTASLFSAFSQVTSSSSSVSEKVSGSMSVFGQPTLVASTAGVSSSSPAFSMGDKPTSIFGQQASSFSVFGTTISPASPFGSVASTTSQTIFGGSLATPNSPFTQITTTTAGQTTNFSLGSSPFGVPSMSQPLLKQNTTSGSLFVQSPAVTETKSIVTSGSSVFSTGLASPIGVSSSAPTFGGASSSFGQGLQSSSGTSSLFANIATPASTGTGIIFGGSSPTTQPPIFGAPNTTQSSIFGSPSTTTQTIFGAALPTTQSSIFGGANPTTQSSIFGGGNTLDSGTASPFSGGSLFSGLGKPPNKEDSAKNVFGEVKAGASLQTAGFGSSPVFGGSPSFGEKSKSPFGEGSIFGGSPSFGAPPAFGSQSVFGGTTSGFSSPSSPSSSGFGRYASSGNVTFGSIANQPGQTQPSGFNQLGQQPGGTGIGGSLGGSSFTSWR